MECVVEVVAEPSWSCRENDEMQVSVSRDQFTDDRPLSLVVLQSRDVRQTEACTGLCKVWLLSVMSCGLDFALPRAGPGLVRINPFCFQARHPTRQPNMGSVCYVITFCVSHRRRKMYCGHVRLCDCLSVCPRPHAYSIAWTRM